METAPVSMLVPMDYPPFSNQSECVNEKIQSRVCLIKLFSGFPLVMANIPKLFELTPACLCVCPPSLSIPLIHSIPITQTFYLFHETIELLYFRHWHWHFPSIWKSLSHISTWLAFWFHTFQLKVISSAIALTII